MKTAISLPDETFDRAESAAQRLGITRSELYARAVDAYVDTIERSSLTARLDTAIDRGGQDMDAADDVVAAGRRLLSAQDDEW